MLKKHPADLYPLKKIRVRNQGVKRFRAQVGTGLSKVEHYRVALIFGIRRHIASFCPINHTSTTNTRWERHVFQNSNSNFRRETEYLNLFRILAPSLSRSKEDRTPHDIDHETRRFLPLLKPSKCSRCLYCQKHRLELYGPHSTTRARGETSLSLLQSRQYARVGVLHTRHRSLVPSTRFSLSTQLSSNIVLRFRGQLWSNVPEH